MTLTLKHNAAADYTALATNPDEVEDVILLLHYKIWRVGGRIDRTTKLILLKHGRRDPAHVHLADGEQGLDPKELEALHAIYFDDANIEPQWRGPGIQLAAVRRALRHDRAGLRDRGDAR